MCFKMIVAGLVAMFSMSVGDGSLFAQQANDGVVEGSVSTELHPVAQDVKVKLKDRDPSKPFAMMVHLEAQPKKARLVVAAMKKAHGPTRKEDGNMAYSVLRDPMDTNKFMVFERWKSLESLDQHLKSEYITELLEELGNVLADEPVISVMHPVPMGKGRGKNK